MKTLCGIALCAALAACGGADDDTVCALGALEGAWLVEYTEMDGTCGALPSEVITDTGADPSCVEMKNERSADLCELTYVYECPTRDNLGTQTWSGALSQSEDHVGGFATLELEHASGFCRSTYRVEMNQI